MSVPIPDDCDIISQTPEKPKKRPKRNVFKNKKKDVENITVIETHLNHTPGELYIDSNPFTSPSYSAELKTNTTKLMSYIFHTHEEFLNYRQDDMPKHNNVRMLGLVKFRSSLYFLKKHKRHSSFDPNLFVIINLKSLNYLPNEDECVEVFGFLEFDYIVNKNLPVLNVRFWRKRNKSSLTEYIKCLELQKSFVPNNYREKVCVLNNTTYLEVANDITHIFDDCDEGMFKNLTVLENNVSGLQEIVNTSFGVI